MVRFNELRITNDGQNLIVDVSIREESYYSQCTIDNIKLDSDDTYIEGSPSSSAEILYKYTPQQGDKLRTLRRIYNINSLNLDSFKDHILYIYVEVDPTGIPSDIPCGMDTNPTIGVTLYMGDIYNQFMSNIRELSDTCNVPQNFINDILQYKAIESSINSGHYIQANKYYNNFFKGKSIKSSSSNCGCYG